MAEIGFIGVGKMGGPMAANLIKSGHRLKVFDPVAEAREAIAAKGAAMAQGLEQAASDVEIVVSMLPTGRHVREVYLDEGGVIGAAKAGALLIDCSTIDVESARAVAEAADEGGAGSAGLIKAALKSLGRNL